jgi:hypothetical protein
VKRAVSLLLLAGCPPKQAEEGPAKGDAASVYRWRVAEATVSPELLRTLMDDFYDLELLLSVSRRSGEASLLVASAVEGQQDSCSATSTLPGVPVAEDGSFAVTGQPVTFSAASLQATLYDGAIQGRLAPDGLTLTEVAGLVDTREFLPLLGTGADAALCEMMPTMGACVPCPDGQPLCWRVSFANGAASPVQAQVAERAREAVCADPACLARCD